MRTLLTSSVALVLSATACTDDSSSPMPPDDEPEQVTHSIGVKVPQSMRIIRGQTTLVQVSIERSGGFTGPVTVNATDLPVGVTAEPIVIAEGDTTGVLAVVGTPSLDLATYGTMTVDATAGELAASAPVDLHMTDPSGAPDITFAITGKKNLSFAPASSEFAHAVAVQPDDKIVVGARDDKAKSYTLIRLLPNGDLDADFGMGGIVSIPDGSVGQTIGGVFVRADGSILFVVRSGSNAIVYAFDSKGELLAGYGNTGSGATVLSTGTIGTTFLVSSAALASDGGLVLGATTYDMVVARLDANGLPMASFDGDGVLSVDLGADESLEKVALRPDGRIVLAGTSHTSHYRMALAQLTPDGQLDTSFSGDGKLVIDTGVASGFDHAAPMADGRLVLSGSELGARRVVVLEPNGDIDTSFDGDGFAQPAFGHIGEVLPTADGIYLAGSTVGSMQLQVGKLGMNGEGMASFGADGVSSIAMVPDEHHYFHAMTKDSQGRLVAVGLNYAGVELAQIAVARFWH